MFIGSKTSKGGRSINEDALFISEDRRVFVIADGAGGHNAGEVASSMVVEGIKTWISQHALPVSGRETDIREYFGELIAKINKKVFERANAAGDCLGMATTIIMVFLDDINHCAYVFNVGDSRVYVLKDDEIIQITEDHTYVNEMLKIGAMSKDDIEEHPMHHVITRAIGGKDTVKIDVHRVKYKEGDTFLLCTDGLYNEVCDAEISRIVLEAPDMQEAAERLIDLANLKKARDNITAICVKI